MSAELEMLNEENGRLRRHITTLNAHCTKVESELAAYQAVVLPVNVFEALERIAELEAELMEQARVNGMGMEREAKLMAKVDRLEQALDVALEALENSRGLEPVDVQWVKGQRKAAINMLKEVRK